MGGKESVCFKEPLSCIYERRSRMVMILRVASPSLPAYDQQIAAFSKLTCAWRYCRSYQTWPTQACYGQYHLENLRTSSTRSRWVFQTYSEVDDSDPRCWPLTHEGQLWIHRRWCSLAHPIKETQSDNTEEYCIVFHACKIMKYMSGWRFGGTEVGVN